MSNWNPNSNKHKANHCGYRKKPSQKEVAALMSMYGAAAQVTRVLTVKESPGRQLKLKL